MGGRAVVVNDEKEDEGQRKTIRQYEQRKIHVVSPSLARALSSVPRSPTFPVACCVCALAPIWCNIYLAGISTLTKSPLQSPLHINTHEIPLAYQHSRNPLCISTLTKSPLHINTHEIPLAYQHSRNPLSISTLTKSPLHINTHEIPFAYQQSQNPL
jgi:hypothetical protein